MSGCVDVFRGSPQERVARQYIKVLREEGDRRRLEYNADERVVVAYDQHGRAVQRGFIGNLAREVLAAEETAREAIYRRYARGLLEHAHHQVEADYGAVRSRLRLLLKDSSYPDYIALLNRCDFPDSKSSPLVFEHLIGDVIACCIEDGDQGLRFVTEDDLAMWGIEAVVALADARSNVCNLPFTVSETMPARYVLNDDSFIASRFVNTRMFDGLQVRGEWVGVVPDRDTFFVADSEDLEAVADLARLAMRQLETGERIISGLPFVLRAGRWQVYEPPYPILSIYASVALQYRAKYWTDFKAALERDLANRGEDIFVASLTVCNERVRGADTYYSMAVWSKGIDTIMPIVDKVYFFENDKNATHVAPWANVVRVMGTEMCREAGLPERHRVRAFPNAKQFISMGAKLA